MAGKFGKFLLFSAIAGIAAAGAYYYLKDMRDEDYFEDSDPDVNDDLEEFLRNESAKGPDPSSGKREYVPLNFSKEAVEDVSEENIIGKPLEETKPSVEKAADTDNDKVSTFSFSSFE